MTESPAIRPQTASHEGLRREGSQRNGVRRFGRIGIRMLAAVALIGGTVAFSGLADSAPAVAHDTVCTGVTVVVDLTDIGGELKVACAEGDQATGRDALLAAGFTATDAQSGFICAINDLPNPCPETFDGNFWSYWNATPTGEWTSYEVGADSSAPAQGSIEGWRYNDGSTPPGIAPNSVSEQLPAAAPEATDSVSPSTDDVGVTSTSSSSSDGIMVVTVLTVSFLALIVIVIMLFVIRNRRNKSGTRD